MPGMVVLMMVMTQVGIARLMMILVMRIVGLREPHVTGHRRNCHGLQGQGKQKQGSEQSANGQVHLSLGAHRVRVGRQDFRSSFLWHGASDKVPARAIPGN